jgi:hypothetical protein
VSVFAVDHASTLFGCSSSGFSVRGSFYFRLAPRPPTNIIAAATGRTFTTL